MVDGRLMGDVGGRREYPSQGRRTLSPHWCSLNHFHFKSTTEDVIVGQLSVQRSNLTPLTAYSPCSPLRHQHPATTIRRKDSRFNNIAQLPRFPRYRHRLRASDSSASPHEAGAEERQQRQRLPTVR